MRGEYKPDFKRSFGSFDSESSKSYKYMLDELSNKTKEDYKFGIDTCIWSWYQNPYFRNHVNFRNYGSDLVVITFEIDEEEVVLSDFDLWCEMLIDSWGIESVVDIDNIDKNACIQAVSWRIPPEGVLSVEPFKNYIKKDFSKRNEVKKFKVGDKVWLSEYYEKFMRKTCFRKWMYYTPLKAPLQKRLTQVVPTNRGTLYQISDGHFPEDMIGKFVFGSYDEALDNIRKRYII